jgi:ABC-type nitrate/sulfonate/bicarbonate transport system permease component
MGGSSPTSEAMSMGLRPRWSVARALACLLVIGIGVFCGMVLAIVAGFSMGWINFQC